MAEANYGWFGTKSTSDVDDVKRRLALQLLLQGTDTSPVQHWTQGAARMANALVGNMALSKMEGDQDASNKFALDLIRSQQTPSSPPASSPSQAPAVNPVVGALTEQPEPGVPLPPANPLAGLSPQFRTQFADLRSAAADRGVNFDAPPPGSIGGVRTPPQQAALFAQGRTAPGPVVTGTLNSNHLTGNALDVRPTEGTTPAQVGNVVTALTQNDPRFANMRSGATFKNLYDPLHVEIPNGAKEPLAPPFGVGVPPPVQQAQFNPQQQGQPFDPQSVMPKFQVPPMVDQVLSDPNAPQAMKRQALEYTKALYAEYKKSELALKQNMALEMIKASPPYLEAARRITLEQEKAKSDPQVAELQAQAAGRKKQVEGYVETDPPLAARKAAAAGLEAGAKTTAEGEAKLALNQKTSDIYRKSGAPAALGLVRDAIGIVDNNPKTATGVVGQVTKGVESFPAGELESALKGIRARLGFDELQKMRAASPTGAALGPVSDTENALLSSLYGGLTPGLRPEVLKQRLEKLGRVYDAVIHGGEGAALQEYVRDIPDGARQMLTQNPGLSQEFDKKYGIGSSRIILGR